MSETNKLARSLTGEVVSNGMDKSIVVRVSRRMKHKVGKTITRRMKIHAHDADNACQVGDRVMIEECAPISKLKSWRLKTIIEKAAV